MERIGIIGVGHLGSAILRGLLRAEPGIASRISICDASAEAVAAHPECTAVPDAAAAVRTCGLVFVCVRPADAAGILQGLPASGCVMLSAVAGLEADAVSAACGAHVLRIMPNMAAALDEAAIAYAEPNNLTPDELTAALQVLRLLGTAVPVSEDDFDTVTGLSGSGPAYAYLFLEGLVAGACRRGLPEEAARLLAAQTLRGAAAIVMDTGESLENLIRGVATPGGTTEAGLRVLEEAGFAETASWAVDAAAARSEQLLGGSSGPGGNCSQLFAKDKFCE